MTPVVRQYLSLMGLLALVALLSAAAASAGLALRAERAEVAALADESQALQARERRLAPKAASATSLLIDAPTVTLAGALLQSRVEAAVGAAGGRLASSQVEVGGGDDKRVGLVAELTIAQADMQKLLFDLETGAPALSVEMFEARALEKTDGDPHMHVALTLSGRWSGGR